MNKRGILLTEETLKIVISVIAISFLIFFLTSLYFARANENTIEQAKQILLESDNSIKNIIENLDNGESKEFLIQYVGTGVDDWHLLSFTSSVKPNTCAGEKCLCICNDVFTDIFDDTSQARECVSNGVCLKVLNLKDEEVDIELEEILTEILIKKENNEISIER